MFLKLAFVGVILVLLAFAVKAEIQPDTNAIDAVSTQLLEKAKPEVGEITWSLISGAGNGFGAILNIIASFSSKYLGMTAGEIMLVLVGISIILGTWLFTKMSQSWGNRFLFIFIIFGIILIGLGLIKKIFELFKH